MTRNFDVATAYLASVARGGAGQHVGALGNRPERPLELYEYEACPFCRKVREMLTYLDLDVRIFPCPRGGERYRPKVIAEGGRAMFPYLVDPNTGRSLYESGDIIRYLADTYGRGEVPISLAMGPVTTLTSGLASALRPAAGRRARASKAPAAPLELWSFEASPYCRLVRETLSSLELPYLLHNVGRGSRHRATFTARAGKTMVPYLVDANTGTEMFESAAIVAYLEATYGAAAS